MVLVFDNQSPRKRHLHPTRQSICSQNKWTITEIPDVDCTVLVLYMGGALIVSDEKEK
jgi:hypothetical protein